MKVQPATQLMLAPDAACSFVEVAGQLEATVGGGGHRPQRQAVVEVGVDGLVAVAHGHRRIGRKVTPGDREGDGCAVVGKRAGGDAETPWVLRWGCAAGEHQVVGGEDSSAGGADADDAGALGNVSGRRSISDAVQRREVVRHREIGTHDATGAGLECAFRSAVRVEAEIRVLNQGALLEQVGRLRCESADVGVHGGRSGLGDEAGRQVEGGRCGCLRHPQPLRRDEEADHQQVRPHVAASRRPPLRGIVAPHHASANAETPLG